MSELTAQTVRLTSLSPGAGCACKLRQASLTQLMAGLGPLAQPTNDNLLIGLSEGDDAAVLRLSQDQALILTTDFFTPIVDSPFEWGRIAAANALSDVYAMGGKPLVALNLAAWPADELPIDMLGEVMRGGAAVATSAGCAVVGGHTIDDPVPKYGMAVVGMAHPDQLLSIDRAAPGDQLILTKPLGTGVISTAIKQGAASEDVVRAAVRSMTTLNASAGETAVAAGVAAATDVTGFGLLGHLHRMLAASGLSGEVYADRVPFLPGAWELAKEGFVSGGTRANISFLASAVDIADEVSPEASILLHDAQTSGGLLMAAPQPVEHLLEDLWRRGLYATLVGRVIDGPQGRIVVTGEQP
ncbi:selenide, water dikinase SelD [[Actinomadura] parvosata]|uniref:selenide, water dikinase SelD n=1 Tax=[Actinomadura] parvosata TaxID=1955412 RepID=UPI00406C7D53